ncbi:MAG: ROK family protein [Bacteroidota bacterium]
MIEVAIGIDIGGTNTKFGIVEESGSMLTQGSIKTDSQKGPKDFLARLNQAICEHLDRLEGEILIKGIGIGAPNANCHRGTIEHPANLPWEGVTPIVEMFQEYFPYRMIITNDANAAAVGEMMFGGAKGMRDFILITLGTGLGSGIVANGQPINGHGGLAGEMGHTLIKPGGRLCGCGSRGCLETYCSATGILRTVFELQADTLEPSALRSVSWEELSAQKIFEEAQKGDPIALKAFELTGAYLGEGLASAVAYFNPEAIFLWGGLTKAGKLIFEPTRRHMEAHLMKVYKGKVKLVPSKLQDINIAVLGAAAMIWKEVKEERVQGLGLGVS